MSNVIYKEFYTYQFVDGDLIIHTWKFLENWGAGDVAYKNDGTGTISYVTEFQDPEKFELENDVFLTRMGALQSATGEGLEIEIDEQAFYEGTAWFEHLRKEKELDEFYEIEEEVLSDYDGDDQEIEDYYNQTMEKEDEE